MSVSPIESSYGHGFVYVDGDQMHLLPLMSGDSFGKQSDDKVLGVGLADDGALEVLLID